jgi:DNA-binding transcriptional MerR regulator
MEIGQCAVAYTSRHVSTLYGVTVETVRNWADEFADYLSPMANPGANRHRQFSDEDMAVFALVSEYKSQGKTYTDIHLALKMGQRGDPPALPPEEVQAIMMGDQERRLVLEVDYLQRVLVRAQQDLDEARNQIVALREAEKENIRLKESLENARDRLNLQDTYSQKRMQELEIQLKEARERINSLEDQRAGLEREVGQAYARGVIEALERKGDLAQKNQKPDNAE